MKTLKADAVKLNSVILYEPIKDVRQNLCLGHTKEFFVTEIDTYYDEEIKTQLVLLKNKQTGETFLVPLKTSIYIFQEQKSQKY